jgi:hypothetical protein
VSDASQGPDWWRASDGMWYPPESHRAYVAGRVTGPTGTASESGSVQMTHAPTEVGAPASAESRPSPAGDFGPFTAVRVVGLAALVVCLIGAFLPWATTDAARLGLPLRSSVAGVDLGAGQLLCGALALALLLSWWHLVNPRRSTATALFATWLGSLALTLYETVDIIAVPTRGFFALDVGAGLYLSAFAALVGSVSSVSDAAQLWSRGGRLSPGALWVGGLAALVVVAAASIVGYRSGVSPVGPVPTATPDRLFHGGAGGSGPSGGSGSGGSSGDTGPSGSTGGSGNTGFGGEPGNSGLGNSGLGNSGPGFFGNSGSGNSGNSGNSGPGAFGNSGSGNSGPGAFGISHLPSSGTPWPSA